MISRMTTSLFSKGEGLKKTTRKKKSVPISIGRSLDNGFTRKCAAIACVRHPISKANFIKMLLTYLSNKKKYKNIKRFHFKN